MNVLKNNKPVIVSLTLLFVILLGCIPTQLVMALFREESIRDDETGINTLRGAEFKVTRLMKKQPSQLLSLDLDSTPEMINNSHSLSKFSIGEQTGVGDGSYNIYDSFNWTGNALLTPQNEISTGTFFELISTQRNDTFRILHSDYTLQNGSFNISEVSAVSDKRIIEDDRFTDPTYRYSSYGNPSNSYFEVAMAFTVEDAWVNLTKVRTYTQGTGSATGLIYIAESTGSSLPNDSTILSSKESIITSSGWHEYTFDEPVLLQGGGTTYFVVMNETVNNDLADWWYYYYVANINPEVNDGQACIKRHNHAQGSWSQDNSIDFPLAIEVLPVEYNGSNYVAPKYSTPQELEFSYNTSVGNKELSSFEWFDWYNTDNHTFQTNTSVSFTLDFIANYTYSSNPILATSSYSVSNNSFSNWNLTFTTPTLNSTYNIRNHSIKISGIESSWDGAYIYWNDSSSPEYTGLDDNVNVTLNGNPANKYVNGSSTMVINASTLSDNTTWYVWFEAPNYLLSFNLSRDGISLPFPQRANVTDIVDLEFDVPETGGNISYWIEYYGLNVHENLNFDVINTTIDDSWNINNTVSQTTNVNGSYNLQGFWKSSDGTKVGTLTRNLDVTINTTLTINSTETIEVLIGEKITIWANYTSNHNSTLSNPSYIRNAKISCNASWPQSDKQNVTMNQPTGTYYNASFVTHDEVPGASGTITITTQLPWFVNWIKTINIKFIGNSSVSVNETSVTLQWRANTTLRIYYNDTLGDPIESATVIVDGNDAFSVNNVYYYRLNTTDYAGEGFYPNLLINASHQDYVSREIAFNLTIKSGETSISGRGEGQNLLNITGGLSKAYANSSADNLSINLRYYYILADDTLNTSTPSVVSQIPHDTPEKESNLTWTIVFYPDKIGAFLINITFSLANYTYNTFVFNLTVTKSTTTIHSEIGTSTTVYYDESRDFFLLYNNTNYNENITGLNEGAGITLNSTNIGFLNRTGDYYWFRLSPTTLPLGLHATNITFELAYFESSSIVVSFEVLARPTSITGQHGAQPLINDTTTINQYYANSSADSVTINLEYYDVLTSSVLDTSAPTIEALILITGTIQEGNLSWTLTFNPNQTGVFLINITFSLANHQTALFIFHLTVIKAQTAIYNSLVVDPTVYYDESGDFFLLYNNTGYNENITGLTEGAGITLNNTNVSFLNRTGDYYWFRLNPTTLPLGLHATNITFELAYFESSSIIVSFEVLARPTSITGQHGAQPLINDTTTINQYYANSSADSVTINLEYYDVLTSSVLDTSAPTIEALILITGTIQEGNLSWTLTFNPNQTGVFLINITFSLANHQTALFIFHLTVIKAQTAIYNSLVVDPTVYYDESGDFFLLYNNTGYNENITGLTEGVGITLNNTNVSFLNRTGDYYWFRLNPTTLPLGLHATNITFEHAYFESSSIIVSFEVLARPTSITGQHGGQPLINDTTVISRYYANSSSDSVIINLEYYDVRTTAVLDTSAPTIEVLIPITGTVQAGNLSWTLTFNPNQTGVFLINITFSLANHQTALFIFHLTVYKAQTAIYTSLLVDPTVYYDESGDFFLLYNNTNHNENITGLIEGTGITLNNTDIGFLNRTGDYYWFRLSPTPIDIGMYATNITFEYLYFESSSIIVSFEVLIRPTSITGQHGGQPLINDTTVISRYYANSSADSVIINLEYYDVRTTAVLDTSAPTIEALILTTGNVQAGNLSWTLTFNPNQTGVFLINITFNLANHQEMLFVCHLTVNKAQTAIYTSLLVDPTVYYDESEDFFLLYNNTNYNENITGLSVGTGITLNNTNVSFLNRTGDYCWFRLSPTPLNIGTYAINITFEHLYFERSSIIVSFEVLTRPTSITGQHDGQPLINDTTTINQYYANSSAGSVIINLAYFDVRTTDVLDTSAPTIEALIPITGTVQAGNLSWTLTFNPNQTGVFLINVTFNLANHQDALFFFHVTINKAQTAIYTSLLVDPTVYYDESGDFFLLYNNTNYNENITGLTEGTGITLNNTNVSFLNRTGDYYWFRLNPTPLPLGLHTTNITFEHLYFESSSTIVSFEVLTRPTNINGQHDGQPLINDTTVITRYFANSSVDSAIINLEYYDSLSSTVLDTSTPTIEVLIPNTGTVQAGNLSWTLTFNPNQTGVFLINITFSLANHQDALFIFHLTVNKAQTTIYNSLPADSTIYYAESGDFFLLCNNTNYNENITGLSEGAGITLNNTNVSFLNRTGDYYWFRLSPTPLNVGTYATNITFEHLYFESSSIIVSFEVLTRPTNINGQHDGLPLINDTTVITKYFANSSADSVIINLAYFDVRTTDALDTSTPTIEAHILITGTVQAGNLSWTLTFNPNQTGVFLINVTFNRANHQVAFFIFHLTVNKAQTTIYNSLPVGPELPYDTSTDFFLLYNNTNYNENITGLTEGSGINLNNTNVSFLNRTGDFYWFRLSPSPLNVGIYAINITFEHLYFESSSIIVVFEVLIHPTSITGKCDGQPLINDTTVITRYFANSSADSVIINLEYYSDISGAILDANTPLIITLIPITGIVQMGNLSWTLIFNPNQTGVYLINVTFSLANHQEALFIFHLTVDKAQTVIYNSLPTDPIIYYDESKDFFLLYNNTNYDENITGLSEGAGITLNNTNVSFLNRTGDYYWFRLSPAPLNVGIYAINITFEHFYFERNFVIVTFEVLIRSTNITGQHGGLPLLNDTTVITRYFANSSADSVIINLAYFDVRSTDILDTSTPTIEVRIPITGTFQAGNLSWTLTFNPNQTGVFLINITFNLANHQEALFILHITVNKAQTAIYNSLPASPELSYDTSADFFLLYNNTNYNENITGLSEGAGITLNNTNVSFLNRTGNYYWFRLSPTTLPIGFHTTNITFEHLYFESSSKIVIFNVFNGSIVIDNSLSNPANGQTIDFLQYGEIYYFNVFLNDSETNNPLNSSIISSTSNLVEFLNIVTDGNHLFSFNASLIGDFIDLEVVFIRENYESITYTISFIVSPREMNLDSSLSSPQTIDYLKFGDIFYFHIYLNDSRTGEPLNISNLENIFPILFENFSITKGFLFRYQSTEIGEFIFEINFMKQYYISYIHSLNFNVTKADSELIPSTTLIETNYSNNTGFSLVWQSIPNPSVNTSPILSILNTSSIVIQPSSPEWSNNIIIENISNGNYSFTVIADRVGTVVITIYLYSDNFDPEPISIDIIIIIDPLLTFEPQISYPLELIVGTPLIISCDEWLTVDNKSVSIDEVSVFNDSISIDYTPINTTDFPFIITIDTEDFRQGFHNLTIKIMSYGHENHSLRVFITLIGREVLITIEVFPENLTQGSDFTIKVTLTYTPLIIYFSGFGSELTLASLEGVPVSFLVEMKYENGTTIPFYYNTTTNASGEAEFTINSKYTLTAEGIESITVASAATTSGKESTQSTPPNFFGNHKFEKKTAGIPEELIILGISIFLLAISLISSIGIYTKRKRKQKQRIAKDSISLDIVPEQLPKTTPVIELAPAPKVTSPTKEIDEIKDELPKEDVTEIEEIQTIVEEPKEKIPEIEVFIEPSPWITLFPPAYSECEKEITYIFNFVLTREGRWYGRASYNLLSKRKTTDISTTKLRKVYLFLTQQSNYFEKEKSSIVITKEGEKIASRILKGDKQ